MQQVPPLADDNAIAARVTIARPVGDVFEFYRDFRNLPRFLGDVMAVEPLGPSTYRWTIQGPLGLRLRWRMRVTDVRANALIRYETIAAPGLKTRWHIRFTPIADGARTEVHETMQTPLGTFGRAGLSLLGKFPAEEVRANLNRLKQLMETGTVTDESYAVRGKFSRR